MELKKIMPYLVIDKDTDGDEIIKKACAYENSGADELIIKEISDDDKTHDKNISIIKEIVKIIDIPVLLGGSIKRVEDVKKYIYAGAKAAVLDLDKDSNANMLKEVCDRFSRDKIVVAISDNTAYIEDVKYPDMAILKSDSSMDTAKRWYDDKKIKSMVKSLSDAQSILDKTAMDYVAGVFADDFNENILSLKSELNISLKSQNALFKFNTFSADISFSSLKLNSDGMIPVIVQDYVTDEVLMLAYMNEEAFDTTLLTGKMTYYSRSRNELWIKGETSSHYQYVKSLTLDCDNDTLLAKVKQVGVACHTGSRSCFFNEVMSKECVKSNPLKVLDEVYGVIADRKVNPKEGSYTNYLFDKGIDKILKKVGEEATEMVIAAKNPDAEELKYEISDFLYHSMVLMVEKGLDWNDITDELARR